MASGAAKYLEGKFYSVLDRLLDKDDVGDLVTLIEKVGVRSYDDFDRLVPAEDEVLVNLINELKKVYRLMRQDKEAGKQGNLFEAIYAAEGFNEPESILNRSGWYGEELHTYDTNPPVASNDGIVNIGEMLDFAYKGKRGSPYGRITVEGLELNPLDEKLMPSAITTKELTSLYQLVLGMAMAKYSYDPDAKRNDATGENAGSISSDLSVYGISITNDTVSKHLKRALEALDYQKPDKGK